MQCRKGFFEGVYFFVGEGHRNSAFSLDDGREIFFSLYLDFFGSHLDVVRLIEEEKLFLTRRGKMNNTSSGVVGRLFGDGPLAQGGGEWSLSKVAMRTSPSKTTCSMANGLPAL